jgi:hypothetical protein
VDTMGICYCPISTSGHRVSFLFLCFTLIAAGLDTLHLRAPNLFYKYGNHRCQIFRVTPARADDQRCNDFHDLPVGNIPDIWSTLADDSDNNNLDDKVKDCLYA